MEYYAAPTYILDIEPLKKPLIPSCFNVIPNVFGIEGYAFLSTYILIYSLLEFLIVYPDSINGLCEVYPNSP
jgi:hypothetical protein